MRITRYSARTLAALVPAVVWIGAGAALASSTALTHKAPAAVAAAINLRPADMPKLKHTPATTSSQGHQIDLELTGCVSQSSRSKPLADLQSPVLSRTSPHVLAVSSETLIQSSATLAEGDVAAAKHASVLACLISVLKESTLGAPPGYTLTVDGAWLPWVVHGGSAAFGLRLTVTYHRVNDAKGDISAVADVIQFAYRQADVLLSVSTDDTEPSTSTERRLVTLLLARAKSATG